MEIGKDDMTVDSQVAIFAGGCFWCMVKPFAELAGVDKVVSGYTGGHTTNPTYEQVCSGKTGHVEAVQITYNPVMTSYEELLAVFWRQIDPTDARGQFFDRGSSYASAIFYSDLGQKQKAEESLHRLNGSGVFDRPVVTRILPAVPFYPAEEYHQDYYQKNPDQYLRYRIGSGRDSFISKHWEKKQ